ncbi:MAG TPA: hypothetical protein VGO47_05550 [Chlamydiales bacterium]|nr:hypothetical protein [Chlamydiales bacterium]
MGHQIELVRSPTVAWVEGKMFVDRMDSPTVDWVEGEMFVDRMDSLNFLDVEVDIRHREIET